MRQDQQRIACRKTGYVPFTDSPSGWASSLTLPVVALAIGGVALIAKITRDSMLSTLRLDYIRMCPFVKRMTTEKNWQEQNEQERQRSS